MNFFLLEQTLFQILVDWINDELADFRIIVKDLEEDLFDGQILQKLIGTYSLLFSCSLNDDSYIHF